MEQLWPSEPTRSIFSKLTLLEWQDHTLEGTASICTDRTGELQWDSAGFFFFFNKACVSQNTFLFSNKDTTAEIVSVVIFCQLSR